MGHQLVNRQTIESTKRLATGVITGSAEVIDANVGGTLSPTDQNIQVQTMSSQGGTKTNISDSLQYDASYTIAFAGSGVTATLPQADKFIEASARLKADTKILTVNEIAGSGFQVGEVLSNTTTPATIGTVLAVIPLNKIDGSLAVDGIISAGASALDLDLTATAAWDTDIYGLLKTGSTFSIPSLDATVYTVTADAEWAADGSVSVAISPVTTLDTVGGDAIVLSGLSYIAIHDLDTAPSASDDLSGGTSSSTATTYAIADAYLYEPSLGIGTQKFVDLTCNMDGKQRITNYARGTTVFTYAVGATPEATFTHNGLYNIPTDTALTAQYVNCAAIQACRGARVFWNGYDMRKHAINNFSLDYGNTVAADSSETAEKTIRGFFISQIDPTASMSCTQLSVSDFDPDTDRLNDTKFVFTYEHNPAGGEMTRIIHVIPQAQQNAMPGSGDQEGRASHDLSLSATVPCANFNNLPQEALIIF